ncbi:MAG: cyclic nucleotide-binding domain-containing protein, partial [Leptospiraceae bacterium]|nr:cyclic nucleotide-binding domain-containing protein [Leptospiraceae bacterium]
MDLKNLKTSHPAKFYLTAKIPIFRDLEEEELMFICERLSLVEYGFGENVYKSGQKEEYFYFLISGEVGVFKNKNEDPVEVYRRGDFIGLVSFLTGEVHNFTAKAITDIRVFRVTRKIFEEITEHIPSLSLKFSKILSNRIRNIKSKKKLKSNLRTIGIISELTEVKTEEYIKKLLENIKTESGQSTVCLNVFFPPEKKIDEGYTEEMDMPFSSYLEKYLETYDIIFLRINKSQFSKIKKI